MDSLSLTIFVAVNAGALVRATNCLHKEQAKIKRSKAYRDASHPQHSTARADVTRIEWDLKSLRTAYDLRDPA
jgi:hypothetical protein